MKIHEYILNITACQIKMKTMRTNSIPVQTFFYIINLCLLVSAGLLSHPNTALTSETFYVHTTYLLHMPNMPLACIRTIVLSGQFPMPVKH